MKDTKTIEKIDWPITETEDDFKFDAISTAGVFGLHFRWLNGRWNLWVTLPDGSVREAGVYPGVVSWSGFDDYGFLFTANTDTIGYNALLLSEVYLIQWV